MQTRIKSVSQLPTWFDRRKYDEKARQLKAAGWYEQLYVRKRCLELWTSEKIHPHFTYAFNLIRENPIVDISNDPHLREYFMYGPLGAIKVKSPYYSLAIHSLTMREFIMLQDNIDQQRKSYVQEWWNQDRTKKLDQNEFLPCQHWIDEPIYNSASNANNHKGLLNVDLRLPNAVLIANFEKFLKTLRKETGTHLDAKKYYKPDYRDWCKFGVLPYLDLKIWEKETNTIIPNRVMATAIYTTTESGEETVRKTTKALAESLITEEKLNELATYAALEISE